MALALFTTFLVYINHSLPCKNMEQCRLCPAKLLSNVDFASQIHEAFILCPAKSWRNVDLAPTKLWAELAPQNHRAIVSGANETTKKATTYFLLYYLLVNN